MSIDDATPNDWDKVTKMKDNIYDMVNNPAHYNTGSIECIEAIEASMSADEFQGYLKANCIKYLWRMSYKGKKLEDCKKAAWYLDKLIKNIEVHN